MSKSRVLTTVIVPLTALILVIVFAAGSFRQLNALHKQTLEPTLVTNNATSAQDSTVTPPTAQATTEAAEDRTYKAILKDGKLYIYSSSEENVPYKILQLDPALLTNADRAFLEKGVTLSSLPALTAFLEDFAES